MLEVVVEIVVVVVVEAEIANLSFFNKLSLQTKEPP